MPLTAEQQHLIRGRIAADSPSPTAAFALWLFFGLIGAHRFYLKRRLSGALLAALCIFGLGLCIGGILFGGTPLDGVFYRPDISDIIRAGASPYGAALFAAGAALLGILVLGWAADAFFIRKALRRCRAEQQRALIAFYQSG